MNTTFDSFIRAFVLSRPASSDKHINLWQVFGCITFLCHRRIDENKIEFNWDNKQGIVQAKVNISIVPW